MHQAVEVGSPVKVENLQCLHSLVVWGRILTIFTCVDICEVAWACVVTDLDVTVYLLCSCATTTLHDPDTGDLCRSRLATMIARRRGGGGGGPSPPGTAPVAQRHRPRVTTTASLAGGASPTTKAATNGSSRLGAVQGKTAESRETGGTAGDYVFVVGRGNFSNLIREGMQRRSWWTVRCSYMPW